MSVDPRGPKKFTGQHTAQNRSTVPDFTRNCADVPNFDVQPVVWHDIRVPKGAPMLQSFYRLRVEGLTSLQLAELKAALAPVGGSVSAEEVAPLPGDRYGEPALLAAAIQFAPAVISVVALWIAKQKQHSRSTFKYIRIGPDGTKEKLQLDLSSYAEGAASAPAIEACMKGVMGDA
jgi:hypothetical protein